ncbi:SsgA family sporulation/cell division regulator [Streptomyces castrisilvae]|uniref:SsgA family sporulation/cell division regulator n=1 Tax=Streptomyces castrisilvae TaxID=3033811 RepID=A0ABY9HIN3_9ACTN|nr:SsgA family sporulation/cell division regulator [Streptomyces sp. Mut1]WLQ34330.1 SsgA family sporulation/cell division regulator [Streptomyces sp. Mut1]
MSPVIHEHARARLVTDARDLPVVPVELRYDSSDTPATVRVAYPGGTEWAVERELLERGLRYPVEQDGWRIWPCGRVQLVVERHDAAGVDVVQFDSAPLVRFIRRTHRETPAPEATRA